MVWALDVPTIHPHGTYKLHQIVWVQQMLICTTNDRRLRKELPENLVLVVVVVVVVGIGFRKFVRLVNVYVKPSLAVPSQRRHSHS